MSKRPDRAWLTLTVVMMVTLVGLQLLVARSGRDWSIKGNEP